MKRALLILLLGLLLLSCGGENKKAIAILARVALMVEQSPDSALSLLDSIEIPDELPEPLYMEYELRRVQARDKLDKHVAEDSIIHMVANYFAEKNDLTKLVVAEFHSGRVYQRQKSYDKAALALMHAEDHAKQLEDDNMLGLINFNLGNLNYSKMLINEAIIRYKYACRYFHNGASTYKNEIGALVYVGYCFWVNQQLDSALVYYNEGLKLAEFYKDVNLQSDICQSIGLALQRQGNIKEGHSYLKNALFLDTDSTSRLRLYRNLAKSFLTMGQQDSALLYANQMLQHLDSTSSAISFANAYHLLAEVEEAAKNYKKSLQHYKLYLSNLDSDMEEVINSSVLEVQKKYDMEKIHSEHNEHHITELWMMILGLLAFILELVLIFILYYRKEAHKTKLLEANNTIHVLRELGSHKDRSFKKTLLKELNIVSEVQLLGAYLSADARKQGREVIQKVNQIVAGHSGVDWSRLYRMCNLRHDGILERLYRNFPALSELQLKICCLTLEDLNNDQQAFVLQRSKGYVQNSKSAIRKIIKADAQCDLREALLKLKDVIL